MQFVSKVLGSNEQRRTRFHTGRGQLLPLASWPQVIPKTLQRLSRRQPVTPWIASSAVVFLNDSIQTTWSIFEFGSGASTAWYAERAGKVESVENNAEWHHQVTQRLTETGATNCVLTRLSSSDEFPGYLEQYPEDSFDLIVVDGHEPWPGHRLECLKVARSKVKSGGLILLDDSDRPEYRFADELLPDWDVKRFIDVKPFPFAVVETSIFVRPLKNEPK